MQIRSVGEKRVLVDCLQANQYCMKIERLSSAAMLSTLSLFFLSSLTGNLVCASRVELVNNGYVDLVVAIKDVVDIQQSNIIIENIKQMLKEATYSLHRATHDRSYLKDVTILIPESWEQLGLTNNVATWENVESADIVIDTPNPKYGDRPYTEQPGGCGDPGTRIRLTPNYVTTIHQQQNIDEFGKPGKVFVHEWAHYRYGVFDEYGKPGDPDYPLFFRPSSTEDPRPNICTDKPIKFTLFDVSNNSTKCTIDPVTQLYDKNCRFLVADGPKSSISSWHFPNSVEKFCDDQTHRSDVKNMHNTKCNSNSVWSIIEKHRDFASGANSDMIDGKHIPSIEFNIVISRTSTRYVVVADVSRSMSNFSRIDKLGDAVRAWIMNDVSKGSQVGMVQFSSDADIVSDLTKITDDDSRKALTDKIPKKLMGATCIGCGLEKALELFSTGTNNIGDTVVLVTDGEHTMSRTPTVNAMSQPLKEAGIRVVTIGFGNGADPDLEILADFTGGQNYYIRDEDINSQNVRDAFLGALTSQRNIPNGNMEHKLVEQLVSNTTSFPFFVDNTIGRNLKLSVYDLDPNHNVTLTLIGPNGTNISDSRSFLGNTNQSLESFSIIVPNAEAGNWTSQLEFNPSLPKPAKVYVTSQLLENYTSSTIETSCSFPEANIINASQTNIRIRAEVHIGSYPVLNATVKAAVLTPNGTVETFYLLDDGINADLTKNDGVYSKYFVRATQQGRYIVTCQVTNSGTAVQSQGFIGSASPRFLDMPQETINAADTIPLANFNRVTLGGSFKVKIPVPENDPYPPGDVRDLSVSLIRKTPTNVTVEVKWTAPGDDLDSGRVSNYELKYSDNETALLESTFVESSLNRSRRSIILSEEDLIAGSLDPNEAGFQQSATFLLVDVPREKKLYIALRAVDEFEKVSHVSNVAVFIIDSEQIVIFESENDDIGDHVISLMVAGFGAVLIVIFFVLLFLTIFKCILSKSKWYSVVPTKSNYAV